MARKNFKNDFNQSIWDEFAQDRYNTAYQVAKAKYPDKTPKEIDTKARQNVNSHKPIVSELERVMLQEGFETFEELDVEHIRQTQDNKPTNKPQLRAFLRHVIINGILKAQNSVIIELMCEDDRPLGEMLKSE